MPKALALSGGFNARWGDYRPGDVLEGPAEDIKPLVDCGGAAWVDETKPAKKPRKRKEK